MPDRYYFLDDPNVIYSREVLESFCAFPAMIAARAQEDEERLQRIRKEMGIDVPVQRWGFHPAGQATDIAPTYGTSEIESSIGIISAYIIARDLMREQFNLAAPSDEMQRLIERLRNTVFIHNVGEEGTDGDDAETNPI